MPRPFKMPDDKASAKEILKSFSEMAYVVAYKDFFEKAIQIIYGRDFSMKLDLSQRMTFCCMLCSKDMNSEIALAQHSHSGSHQKNLDKKMREQEREPCKLKYYHNKGNTYNNSNSLQYMLDTSPVRPIGLQMLEEYERPSGGWSYYKCNLCGAHGRLDAIYRHATGNRHTEKYIKSRVVLKNSFLTANEREVIRKFLVRKENISVESIKTYRDRNLYPLKWEKLIPGQGALQKKREAQWISRGRSQSPSTSRHSSSSSPDRLSEGYPEYSRKREREPSPPQISQSPKNELSEKSTTKSLSMYRNKSPPPVNNDVKPAGQQTLLFKENVTKQDQSTQKFDLEELMVQLNIIVKTSHVPEYDIHTQEDAKLALDMMFRISSALHFITKSAIENSEDKSQHYISQLVYKKSLLSKIMGSIKLRMEAALLGKHST